MQGILWDSHTKEIIHANIVRAPPWSNRRAWGRLKIPDDRVAEGRDKGPIESPQLKETPNYQSGATAISENDLT